MRMNKLCPRCKETKPLTEEFFYRSRNLKKAPSGFQGWCKQCARDNTQSKPVAERREGYREWDFLHPISGRLETRILWDARGRARRKGLLCDIEVQDVVIPPLCPVLGIPLIFKGGKQSDNSPSLDRIVPSLGYVKGNVRVISWRANDVKGNATADELEAVARYVRSQ